MSTTIVSIEPTFKPGDPPPSGYANWFRWAAVQSKAGLKQSRCPVCNLARFPQEMSEEQAEWTRKNARGKVLARGMSPICLSCFEIRSELESKS